MEYIGASTRTPELSTNYFGSHPKLKQDIKTMDKSIIKKVIVCETDDIEYLAKCELTVIKKMKAVEDPKFYNSSAKSGFPMYGKKTSEEAKEKLRSYTGEKNSRYGAVISDDQKAKVSKANTGKKHTEETKERLRVTSTGNTNALGHKHSDESKAKMSKAKKGKKKQPFSDQHKANISAGKKGAIFSDKHKAKLKAAWIKRRAQS
mgnify:CR=1 FL=1